MRRVKIAVLSGLELFLKYLKNNCKVFVKSTPLVKKKNPIILRA